VDLGGGEEVGGVERHGHGPAAPERDTHYPVAASPKYSSASSLAARQRPGRRGADSCNAYLE
jgi:hypothetical protein